MTTPTAPTPRRCALVTGATQGMGLAIARCLAHAGCDVVLHGMEPVPLGNAIAAELARQTHAQVAYVRAKLANAHAASRLVDRATAALRAPDILVNNAGIQHACPIESLPPERWHAILAVNLSAAFFAMQAAVPGMRQRGWGRVVNIASVHGLVASVNNAAYLAAKHGLVGLSKGVAMETAAQGITVNCICPGWTQTPTIAPHIEAPAALLGGVGQADIQDLLRQKQPKLSPQPPARIGDVAVFLCSDAAAGITGVALPVDGDWAAH